MCNENQLNTILSRFAVAVRNVFGDKLKAVVLYGSYARGDYDSESDIDILLLVDIDKLGIKKYHRQLVKITSDLELKYDIVISPLVENIDEFEKYKEVSTFFRNVDREGVRISA